MDHVLVIGIDSTAGRSAAAYLSTRFTVCGLWLESPDVPEGCSAMRMSAASLAAQAAKTDTVIFCGDAARSSWDDNFGQFDTEQKWLDLSLRFAEQNGARFVFLSSDAIFDGPWMFHDDDSRSYSDGNAAISLLEFESRVAALCESLIIRTNVLSVGTASGFPQRILERLEARECEQVDARTYSTPLAPGRMAELLTECLLAGTTGVMNIGGAERTTPFGFATALAGVLGYDTQQLMPADGTASGFQERSLRCSRLRHELKTPTPVLKETLEEISTELFGQLQQAAAA